MKFWIITPTFNRYKLLKECIKSVLVQNYNNFELIIIDDSTNNETFNSIKKDFNDIRIKYLKNKKNRWVNFSRNVWLDNISNNTDYIIFLDDDDSFNINTLIEAKKNIELNNKFNWFISNRKWITKINKYNIKYDYFNDYLFWNKIIWDVTHCISKKAIWKIRFSTNIKQAQEWLFFIELWEKYKIFTYDFDSTISKYLEWWLSDSKLIKVLLWKILWVLEFLFIRNIRIRTKINFIKRIIFK